MAAGRQEQSPPPGPEREFKLELLERTVSFVKGLLERTRTLERELVEHKGDNAEEPASKRKRMATPASSPSASPSRDRDSAAIDDLDLDGSSALSEPDSSLDLAPSPVEAVSPRVFPTPAPRRSMSIAALLSPSTAPLLPSPPPSGHLRSNESIAENTGAQMETLSLPSPEVALRRERGQKRPREDDGGEKRLDEDTVAATLLLQFSSKTPRTMLGMQ